MPDVPPYLDTDPTLAATRLRLSWLWVLLAILGLSAAIMWGLMRYTNLGKRLGPTVAPASSEKPGWVLNGGFDKYPVEKPTPAKTPEDATAKALEEFKRQMALALAAKQREIDELKRRPQPPPAKPAGPPPPPKEKKRAQPIYLVNEQPLDLDRVREYTLPIWTYIPCVLENVLNSEIPGHFTVRTRRPVYDASGAVMLIPHGARIGAKAESGDLLLGNERIPTFALSLQRRDGTALELGEAPIMDAAGTNGLTGDVDNHTWRLIWTSIFIGGLQGGQQVLQTQLGNEGAGPIATGITRQGSTATQMRLGRAQDTRPTITAFAGEPCQILTTKAMQLPEVD